MTVLNFLPEIIYIFGKRYLYYNSYTKKSITYLRMDSCGRRGCDRRVLRAKPTRLECSPHSWGVKNVIYGTAYRRRRHDCNDAILRIDVRTISGSMWHTFLLFRLSTTIISRDITFFFLQVYTILYVIVCGKNKYIYTHVGSILRKVVRF